MEESRAPEKSSDLRGELINLFFLVSKFTKVFVPQFNGKVQQKARLEVYLYSDIEVH